MTLGRAGTPTVVITTTAFEALARQEAHHLGVGALPLLVIEHPLGGESPARVREKAARAAAQLTTLLVG